jgi:uncharacterized protein YdaU (DUF1376 family)
MSHNKLFWMRWDIQAAQRDTSRLNATLYGAYMSLIEEEFINGPLPNEIEFLCNKARLFSTKDAPLLTDTLTDTSTDNVTDAPRRAHGERERMIYALLGLYFELGPDNCWRQKRVEAERNKALKTLEINRERTKKATLARWKNRTPADPSTSPSTSPSTDPLRMRQRIQSLEGKASTRDSDSLRSSPSLPDGAAAPRGGSPNPASPAGKPAPSKTAVVGKQNETKAKPRKPGSGRIAKGGNGGTGTAGSRNSVAVGLRGGVEHLKKLSNRRNGKNPVDSRVELFRDEVFRFWEQQNLGDLKAGKCPWATRDLAALLGLLRASPEMTLETFRGLLMNRAHSEVVASDPPRNWLAGLKLFAAGPLDRYRHALKVPRTM